MSRDARELPGDLVPLNAPGQTDAMFALWHPRKEALFLVDLLTHQGRGPPKLRAGRIPGRAQAHARNGAQAPRAAPSRAPLRKRHAGGAERATLAAALNWDAAAKSS